MAVRKQKSNAAKNETIRKIKTGGEEKGRGYVLISPYSLIYKVVYHL
jgi:hypothetical protein